MARIAYETWRYAGVFILMISVGMAYSDAAESEPGVRVTNTASMSETRVTPAPAAPSQDWDSGNMISSRHTPGGLVRGEWSDCHANRSLSWNPYGEVRWMMNLSGGVRWWNDQRINRTGNESTLEGIGRIRAIIKRPSTRLAMYVDLGLHTQITDTSRDIENFDANALNIRQLFFRYNFKYAPFRVDVGARYRSWRHLFFSELGPIIFDETLFSSRTYQYSTGIWLRYRRAQDRLWLAGEIGLVNGEGNFDESTRDTNSSKSVEFLGGIVSPSRQVRFQGFFTVGDGAGSTPIKRRDTVFGIVSGVTFDHWGMEFVALRYDHGYYETDVSVLEANGVPIPTPGLDQFVRNRGPFLQEDIDLDRPGRLWIGRGGHIRFTFGPYRYGHARDTRLDVAIVYSVYDPDRDRFEKNEFKWKRQLDTLVTIQNPHGVTWYARWLVMDDPYFRQEFVGNNNYKTEIGMVLSF